MKTILSVLILALVSGHFASAACGDTSMSVAAKTMRLSGKLTLQEKKVTGELLGGEENDVGVRISKNSDEYQYMKNMAADMNSEIISTAYGFKVDASVMAIVRNKTTCEISILGTDGEDAGLMNVVADSIHTDGISFQRGSKITTVTRVKKSFLLGK